MEGKEGVSEISIHYSWCLERWVFVSVKTVLIETESGSKRWISRWKPLFSSPPNCRHSVQGCLRFPLLTLSPFPQEIKRASLRFSGNSNLQLKKLKPILTNVGKNYFTCGSQNGCSPCFSKCKDFGKLSQKRRLNIQSVSSSSFPRRSESWPHLLGCKVFFSQEKPSDKCSRLLKKKKNVYSTRTLMLDVKYFNYIILNLMTWRMDMQFVIWTMP